MATVTPTTCASPLGRIIAIRAGSVAPISVTMTINGVKQELQSLGLCTRLAVSQSVIAQFQNTFDSFIYITPFGDKPGDIALTFIVNKACDSAQETLNAIDFYVRQRLLPTGFYLNSSGVSVLQKNFPIIVAVGSLTLRGFVVGLDIQGTTEGSAIVQATLRMTGWPA